jgi:hypothetical protein
MVGPNLPSLFGSSPHAIVGNADLSTNVKPQESFFDKMANLSSYSVEQLATTCVSTFVSYVAIDGYLTAQMHTFLSVQRK